MGLLGTLLDHPTVLYALLAAAVLLAHTRFGPRGGVTGAALVAVYVLFVPSRQDLFVSDIERVFATKPAELNSYGEWRRQLSDEQGVVLHDVCAVFLSNDFFGPYREHMLAVAAAPPVWRATDKYGASAPLYHRDLWQTWIKVKRQLFKSACQKYPRADIATAAMTIGDDAITELSETLMQMTMGENNGHELAKAFRGAAALGDDGDEQRARVFLDIGSGRGKVVSVACAITEPSVRFAQCRGVEISEQRVLSAREHIARVSLPEEAKQRIDVRTLDAADARLADVVYGNVTMLYAYNTVFDELDDLLAPLAAEHLPRGARVVLHVYSPGWRNEAHRLPLVGTVAAKMLYTKRVFVLQKK